MQYTIKDILNYNNPCIQCGTGTALRLQITHKTLLLSENIVSSKRHDDSRASLEFAIQSTYDYSLKLIINCETNEYKSEYERHKNYALIGVPNFKTFISEYNLKLRSSCSRCSGWIEFSNLEFRDDYLIGPTSLSKEFLYLKSNNKQFYLSTDLERNITNVHYGETKEKYQIAFCNGAETWWPSGHFDGHFSDTSFPAISLSSFKKKQEMVEAIETYIMLS
jgi:hypothetical protein